MQRKFLRGGNMHSLKGMDQKNYTIGSVMMVGALLHRNIHYIDPNDHLLLRIAVQTLGAAGFEFSDAVSRISMNRTYPLTNGGVEVLNIRKDMGGRDFLKEKPKGDLVIFYNIPRDGNAEYGRISPSFALSARHHEPGVWPEVTAQTGAKAVVAFGGEDCLRINDFSKTQLYHPVFMTPTRGEVDGHVIETLVARNILENGEAFFSSIGAPLEQACIDYQQSPGRAVTLKVPMGPRSISRADLSFS